MSEKSTLWTDTGVDQNFQRDLGAIGPSEFQGKIRMDQSLGAVLSGKICMDQWLRKFVKSSPPRLGLVCGRLFPACTHTELIVWRSLPSCC